MSAQRDPRFGVSAIIFGPQAMSFDVASFNALRSRLLNNAQHQWVLQTIAALPGEWAAVSNNVAILKNYDGAKLLSNLNDWLKTGNVPSSTSHFPNILLAPMVATDHLISYLDFLQAAFPDLRNHQELPESAKSSLETLGLSLGTLSAFAVSSSSTIADIQKYGAIAMRLAMLVGAVGDAEDLSRMSAERALSFSPFWKSPALHDVMLDTLEAVPDVSHALMSLLPRFHSHQLS